MWFGENPKGTVGTTAYRARGVAGTDRRGNEVYVEIQLVDFAVPRETDDHRTVEGYRDLRVCTNGGQDHWALLQVADPSPGLTLEQLRDFGNAAMRWHMSGRDDVCAHQSRRGGPHGTGETDPCPITGRVLEWPPAVWYVRELPAEVEASVREIGANLA